MRRFIATLLLLILTSQVSSAYTMFSSEDKHKTVLKVSPITKLQSNCSKVYKSIDIYTATSSGVTSLSYKDEYTCKEDYLRLQEVMFYDMKTSCMKYGGGSACNQRF